jgi:hypothetical protein
VDLVLDLLQAAGLGAAAGLAPFLPALVAGAFATADTGVDFEGTPFAFLEEPWWLVVMTVGVAASVLARTRLAPLLPGTGIGLGGLLGAGAVADRSDAWPAGLALGVLCAVLAIVATGGLLERVRARLDREAANALPLYVLSAAVVVAVLAIVLPPAAVLVVGLLVVLLVRGRRREGEKYAGLRILR